MRAYISRILSAPIRSYISPLGRDKDAFLRDFAALLDADGRSTVIPLVRHETQPNTLNCRVLAENTARGFEKLTGLPFLHNRQNNTVMSLCQSLLYNLRPDQPGVGMTTKAAMLNDTTPLQGFVYALPLLRPNVIPLYINVNVHMDVGQTIAAEVGRILRYTPTDMQALSLYDNFLYGARAAVRQHNKYLLLILDGIEAVWKSTSHDCNEAHALLLHLANNGQGTVGTLICGSTVSLDRLITGAPVDGYVSRLSLNRTKFPMTRIV